MYYCINGTWVCKVHTYVVHSLLWFNIGTSPYTCKKLIYVLVIWASLRFFSPEQDHATQDCICCGYCGGVGDHCSPDIWYCQDQTSRRQQRVMTKHWGWLTHFLYVYLLFEYSVFLITYFSRVPMYACEWVCTYVYTFLDGCRYTYLLYIYLCVVMYNYIT